MEKKLLQTILIVDDDKSSLDIVIEALSNQYEIIVTTYAKQALEILQKQQVDLILLDILMPDIDGFETCKIIKSHPKTSPIPIIFITSNECVKDKQKAFDLGAVDYLVKPYHTTELLVRVKNHLHLYQLQRSLEAQVKIETKKNLLQSTLLVQQAKQSEIGEMLIHIAHQWKQPLSELGSINLYHQLYLEKNNEEIDKKKLIKDFKKYATILEFMSNTVETFQNFYLPSKQNHQFSIYDAIVDAKNIVDATYHFHGFTIEIEKKDECSLYGKRNEYAQIVLAILNNIKTIFLQRKTPNPKVIITLYSDNTNSIVTIEDNGGGIEKEIIDKIFSPYTSGTKTTGIGLYMAKEIIEKFNGTISAHNQNYGAKFILTV